MKQIYVWVHKKTEEVCLACLFSDYDPVTITEMHDHEEGEIELAVFHEAPPDEEDIPAVKAWYLKEVELLPKR